MVKIFENIPSNISLHRHDVVVAAKQSARRVLVTHVIISSYIGGDQQLLGNMNNLNVSAKYLLTRYYCNINHRQLTM